MVKKITSEGGWLYDPVVSNTDNWPIVKLSNNHEEFLQDIVDFTYKLILEKDTGKDALYEELARTLYLEKIRLKGTPWKADAPDEKAFWNEIKKDVLEISPQGGANEDTAEEKIRKEKEILLKIIRRYSDEIAGQFDPLAYGFVKEVVTWGFSRLLNAGEGKGLASVLSARANVYERLHIVGEIEELRNLSTKGTIIMVPTHFSNLDSMLIGWVIRSIGLPPFLYGAGLNLFGIKILAYFMNRVGAYKVDRRKKNQVYLETLKAYSTLAIQRGCHSLFFPGGTRSRSGGLESKLKLGLLGTAMEAQRLNFEQNPELPNRVFVVPVVFSYNFVLEAQGLISEFLKSSGQEHYIENDQFSTSWKMIKFVYDFISASSEIYVSIGKCMDLFGNELDEEGRSLDKHGNEIDISKYFFSGDKMATDPQRDAEYVKMLGDEIVKRFHKENVAFASHLVAFTAFEILKKRHKRLDLYALLRLPVEELRIDYNEFSGKIKLLIEKMRIMHGEKLIKLEPKLEKGGIDDIIVHGIKNLEVYHSQMPLYRTEQGEIATEDMNLLYYYHNRLTGYKLEALI